MRLKANKYARWYRAIVSNPDATATYTENHHIHPVSMGGKDVPENRVRLSARQHFVAHWLLTKAVPKKWNDQAWAALRSMALMRTPGRDFKVTARLYEELRIKHANRTSELAKLRWQDPEYRAKQAAAYPTEKRREAALKASTPEVNEKKRQSRLNKKHSEETKQKMSATRVRRYAEDPDYKARVLKALNG
jgi:hypothetical protein